MEEVECKLKEHYLKNLDPKEFKEFKILALRDANRGAYYDFWFSCLYEFFSSGKCNGASLLDLGSGPVVHNIASASAFVSNITLSELVESNREALEKWLKKDSDCLDWTEYLQRVARAEGRTDLNSAVLEIESRIRCVSPAVVPCNLLEDEVLPKGYSQEPYDIVLTSLTVETAAVDLKAYSKILGRINRLLKPGGKLLMMGVFSCSFWQVGAHKFHYLTVEQIDIQNALEENGFGDMQWKTCYRGIKGLPYDGDTVYFLTCTKL